MDSKNMMQADMPQPNAPIKQAIGRDQVKKAREILQKYKKGKATLEDKIIKNDRWWKMRHWELLENESTLEEPKPSSGWLFNTIISKHADYMDSFPTSDILPREEGDTEEAHRLASIIPVIMEQNDYKNVYSEEAWYKLKNGTGVYGIFWDQDKLNGLGDISITCADILGLYWEPGVKDIQKSQNFFSVELVDNELLYASYPEVRGKLKNSSEKLIKQYWYDDSLDTTGKSAVVDWYYKKVVNGKKTLQFVKFVDEIVLYATENDTEVPMREEMQVVPDENGNPVQQVVQVPAGESMAQRGLYDHGMYPFVFDPLFPEVGQPTGFGFVDVCKNAQTSIDVFNNAFEKNVQFVASPRYLVRNEGGINEAEFCDPHKLLIHVDGNLGEDSYQPVNTPTFINSNYISILDQKIQEMKETSGNRDTNTGGSTAGVTAASAIAAMQEAAGKTSRDQISRSYEAHKQVVSIVIELIRQFYDMPRQFRIVGQQGEIEFAQYTNEGLQPQYQGNDFGQDMGYRMPVFDVAVKAEKDSAYSQMSQNELAIQFYNMGFFNPQMADQALACIDMMDFEGKQKVTQKIQQNGGMYQQILQMQQQMLQLAQIVDASNGTDIAPSMADAINESNGGQIMQGGSGEMPTEAQPGGSIVNKAREQAQEATRPR